MIPEPLTMISSAIGFAIYKIIKHCIGKDKHKHKLGLNEIEDLKEV